MVDVRCVRVIALTVAVAACGSPGGTSAPPPPVVSSPTPSPSSASAPSSDPSAPPTSPPGATAPDPDVPGGLQLCGDVPVVTTDVIGAAGTGNLDPIFQGVVLTYVDEHRDVFGGWWIDREAGGTLVIAFTDDPTAHLAALRERRPSPDDVHAVEPMPEVTDDRPLGEWGVAFDVVQVEHSEDELVAATDPVVEALRAADLGVDGTGTDVLRNRMGIFASEPVLAGDVAAIEAVLADAGVPMELVCLDAMVVDELPTPIEPGTALDVIELPDDAGIYPADTEVECGGVRFDLGDLAAMTPLDDIDPGLRAVVDGWLADAEGQFWPQDGWMLLTQDTQPDGERATLVGIDEQGLWSIHAEMGRNGWIWAGADGGGQCDVRRVLPAGLGTVDWELDPAFPAPTADSTELHLLATEQACTGASEMGERMLGPQVVETADAVRVAFAAIPLTGDQTCPGNPSTAVPITLSAPLGDRSLLDGLEIGPLADLLPG